MLAEVSTTEISKEQKPKSLNENKQVARKGGNAAKKARQEIEKQTGKSVVSQKNAKQLQGKELSENIGINQSAIQKHLDKLKQKGLLKRIGADRGGYWEIISSS